MRAHPFLKTPNAQFKLFLLVNLPKRKWSTRFLSRVGRRNRRVAYVGGQVLPSEGKTRSCRKSFTTSGKDLI
jgi:hypothetical protein